MGIGIMIQRLHADDISDILGYCILIIFGICLQLYAVFDIFKYVEGWREDMYVEAKMLAAAIRRCESVRPGICWIGVKMFRAISGSSI